MKTKTFAAIDVGSFEISMKIFEFSGKNTCRVLDRITQRIPLGRDTYADGIISSERMDELCRVLKEFSKIMKMYQVAEYRAYGTSAIRETKNTNIVLDQIEQRTGIHIEILSNSEQRFLDYKSIAFKGQIFRDVITEGTAIVDIGGGSIQLSLFDKDTLMATQNMKLGVFRLQEWTNQLKAKRSQIEELTDELVSAQLSTFKKMYLKDKEIKTVIIVDDYLSQWITAISRKKGKEAIVNLAECEEFMQMLQTKSYQEMAKYLEVSEEAAELTLLSACIIRRVMKLMGAERIWAPGVSLSDGIAYEYAEQNKMLLCDHDFEKDIVTCATNISKRYLGSRKRAETLESISLAIFDSMKKVHGLGKRERLYLRIASLLHDCGKYISMVEIGESSYAIVMATEIIGLSHPEREMIANIVRYNHSDFVYYDTMHERGSKLTKEAYLTVAKLTAILRVASGLDRSHKQKVKGVKATLNDNQLVLLVDTQENITLEKGLFHERAEFFEEVYCVKPIIRQKKTL